MDVFRRSEGGGGRVGLGGAAEARGARLSGPFFSSFADIRRKP